MRSIWAGISSALAIFLYPLGYVAVWPAVAGMIIVGLPGALTLAGLITLFQRSSEDAYRGRVFGALSALEGSACWPARWARAT